MPPLDDAAIAAALGKLPGWRRDGDTIVRQFKRRDWRDAIALVDAVAAEADKRDHHPDICVTGYRTVTFTLTSHSDGGITNRDLAMAAEIDRLAAT